MNVLNHELWGIAVDRWLIAAGVAVVVFTALRVVKAVLVGRLQTLSKRTETEWDDIIVATLRKTNSVLFAAVGIYAAGVTFLQLESARSTLRAILVLALLIQFGIWCSAALSYWMETYRKRKVEDDVSALTHLGAVRFLANLFIWSTVLLMTLANLGVQIGPIIAGMGVGGIAVALAVQNILGDLFASLSIVLDKPFEVGDFVIVGDFLGSVERVGLKTTRVRSLSGEELIFSNNDLLQSRLRNYGRLYERRIVFQIGVVYQTPREQLKEIPDIIKAAIEAQSEVRFDRSHFKEYGNFSLNFESVYYVLRPEYNVYMDVQHGINLQIHEEFEQRGIEFAYPTQTLFVTSEGSGSNVQAEGSEDESG